MEDSGSWGPGLDIIAAIAFNLLQTKLKALQRPNYQITEKKQQIVIIDKLLIVIYYFQTSSYKKLSEPLVKKVSHTSTLFVVMFHTVTY